MVRQIFNFVRVGRGALKATLSIDHGNGLVTHHWKVLEKEGVLEVVVPQVRLEREFIDVLEFKDKAELDQIKAEVLSFFRAAR